ncbi:GFA family protein [Lacibacterium aquatile]|uniref:GFA family protein n=1 Tax=Lacibacterium aquatile TaxID=1168082 RepID=A0ABW5DT33_9PROT
MHHTGSCHCGAVKFEVDTTIDRLLECNCSICRRKGHLLAFAPASAFTLLQGEEALSDYQFNKKVIHHRFCKTCGVGTFGQAKAPNGQEMVAINVRCLDNFDVKALPVDQYDGASL